MMHIFKRLDLFGSGGSMESAENEFCMDEKTFNPVFAMGTQMFGLLVMAQIFQLILKPLVQIPGPISQILVSTAGFVLGPTALSKLGYVQRFFTIDEAYYKTAMMIGRQIIMLMMGMQMDIPSMKRHFKPSIKVTLGSVIAPSIYAVYLAFFDNVGIPHGSIEGTPIVLMMILSNTASPLVARMVSELKLTSTRMGQLATYSSLINDIFCLIVLAIWSVITSARKNSTAKGLGTLLGAVGLDVVATMLFNRAAIYVNNSHRERCYLTNAEVLLALAVFILYANVNESVLNNSMVPCFFVGLMLPRDGKTTRTLLLKLRYPVYVFVLPIYFGYIGFQTDFLRIWHSECREDFVFISFAILGGRISGTLVACRQLEIPLLEGVVLSLLLCVKGFTDLLVLDVASPIGHLDQVPWYKDVSQLFMVSIVISTLIAGLIATFILNTHSTAFGFRHIAIEMQNPEGELIMLSCVHDPRHVWTMVGLMGTLTGSEQSPVLPSLLHLIELPERATADLKFHELVDEDEEELLKEAYGNDAVEINDAVDDFVAKTGITLREGQIISPYTSMYEEVCDLAEDLRSSIIIVSFHKHQRIDGKMESDKREGIRTTNRKLLRHAPCSVAILVDKGRTAGSLQVPVPNFVQEVATLFFGGPDDREALALSRRIGVHPHVNLTVIRFVHMSTRERDSAINMTTTQDDEEDFISISTGANERDLDNAFMSEFFNRYVTSGQIGFVEKYVNHGADTVNVLKDMGDMYSLFIVGKGGRDNCPMTAGMSDWEECPELGKIGDLLASSDIYAGGSILVIQQRSFMREHR